MKESINVSVFFGIVKWTGNGYLLLVICYLLCSFATVVGCLLLVIS
jgi:hypothetical protein